MDFRRLSSIQFNLFNVFQCAAKKGQESIIRQNTPQSPGLKQASWHVEALSELPFPGDLYQKDAIRLIKHLGKHAVKCKEWKG